MRYDHFSMLPEQAFQPRSGRFGMTLEGGGSGGGGSTSSTVTQTNIPEYARPYVESMLGATMKQMFETKPTGETVTPAKYGPEGELISPETRTPAGLEITGFKEYKPYSQDPSKYFAGFSPMQQQMFGEAAGMQTPGQYGQAAGMAGIAGQGGLDTAGMGYMYGGQGADIGQRAATMARQAAAYGRGAADIGQQGADVAGMGFGAGRRYEQMATSPGAMQAYMSPYMQNVVDVQKQQAVRDYQENIMPQIQAQATRAGAFGGSRDAVQRAMAQRGLAQQLQNIQATGQQQAFQQAQQAQQYGADLGLRGLGAGLQGLQTGIAGQQAGMQGVQGALAGTSQALQGAQLGLQGVGAAQAGYGLAGQQAANLANIGSQQQAADIARMQFQGQVGGQQQAQEQAKINQAIQDYAMQQEYPRQSLSFMNAMLRGLPMQATTTQSYMPGPNIFSQVGGMFPAAIGTYGMGRMAGIFKEGGKVKEMASGGISREVFFDPDKYSSQQIKSAIDKGVIDGYIGYPILQDKIKEEKQQAAQQMQRAMAAQQGTASARPASTIAQEIESGITAAPSNLPLRAAGGGIIAFSPGGSTGSSDPMFGPIDSGESAAGPDTSKFTDEEKLEYLQGRIGYPQAAALNEGKITLDDLFKSVYGRTSTMPSAPAAKAQAAATDAAPPKKDTGIKILPDEPKKERPSRRVSDVAPVDYGKGIDELLTPYLKQITAGMEDPKEARKAAAYEGLANLGFGMMAGTSPFFAANVGPAGQQAVGRFSQRLGDIRDTQSKQLAQLASLGLKGAELKQEARKLGIMEPLYREQAAYYSRRSGTPSTAGLGSVPGAVVQKELNQIEGYKSNPATAPFFSSLPREAQIALTKTPPGSPSYSNAMRLFNQAANDYMAGRLNVMRAYGAKTNPLASLLDQD